MVGPEIEQLIAYLSKLPGLGPRSARRAALYILKRRDTLLLPLSNALNNAEKAIGECEVCGNLDSTSPCTICSDEKRDHNTLCIVEEVVDLWAIERSGAFKGYYHVLGGLLSPLDGIGPEDLNISSIIDRIRGNKKIEIILAMSATVDGQTTAHYVADMLADHMVNITRLAHGVPVGGELDYLDDGTLTAALNSRREI
tara:strand:+ start:74319 stop:74912 length:594 start_codon:yes stop_codon:yes gene_type:complete